MWSCSKCGESVEDTFDVCRKCGTSWDGVKDAGAQTGPKDEMPEPGPEPNSRKPIDCARCREALQYVGRKRFHEGTNWGILGEIGELFVKREHFDVYVCSRCGGVEFFVDGIGEQFRPN